MTRARWIVVVLALGCDLEDDILEVAAATTGDTGETTIVGTTSLEPIVQTCDEPPCILSCLYTGTCEQSCVGQCMTTCEEAALCDVTCTGPDPTCLTTCRNADECTMSCPDGTCVLSCENTTSCHITDCNEDCTVSCGGAEDCSVSCNIGQGCVITP